MNNRVIFKKLQNNTSDDSFDVITKKKNYRFFFLFLLSRYVMFLTVKLRTSQLYHSLIVQEKARLQNSRCNNYGHRKKKNFKKCGTL